MKTFSLQHALFPLLLLLSGSSFWFLQVRSNTLQSYKNQQLPTYPMLQEQHHSMVFMSSKTEQTEEKEALSAEDKKEQDFQEDQDLLPDVQLLKFILDKSKEGLPVLRLPAFLYR